MANQSTFPTTLDGTPTDMGSGDTILSSQWNQYMDAIDQLETKVGVDSSAVTGSIDYKLAYKDIGEGYITILPWHYSSITQGTWGIAVSSSFLFNGYWINSSNGQNDQIDFKAFLAAGTYTFSMLGSTYSERAISTLLFNGESQGTLDWYGSLVYNVIKTITGITVSSAGLKTISLKVATRNASASAWYITVGSMALFRTA